MKEVIREEIIKEFVQLMREYTKKFGNVNITRDWWRERSKFPSSQCDSLFGSFSKLKAEVMSKYNIKRREHVDIKSKATDRHNVYFVTSVVEGSKIDKGFLNSIDAFCKRNSAKRVLLWVRGVRKNSAFTQEQFELFGDDLVTEFSFNEKLKAKDFMLHPAQILPLTGLSRFGNRDSSLIIASTKQHMTSVPRARGSRPHTMWSTGTLSLPEYSVTRAGSLANQDNTLGGLVVEVEDSKKFYIRPVQYKNGSFIDMGVEYRSNGSIKSGIKAEAIVWGDLHLTEEDQDAVMASIDQANYFKAKNIIVHDICSWNSVNHHDQNNYIVQVGSKVHTLEDDYNYSAQKLDEIIKQLSVSTIRVVKSNHDLWVKRWVNAGNFIKDKNNSITGALAFIDFCNGKDPIEKEIKSRMSMKNRIEFLKQEQQFKVCGYELGQHGENGANGSRGTIQGIGRAHDKIVVGHSHSPNIFYSAIQVGTNSKLQLPYAHGASSWMHANCVIYPNGTFQLLTFIDKSWHLTK